MEPIISVYQVYTPSTTAKEAFVDRLKVNNRLVDAIRTPGKQIVLFGHSGSGKTTLIEKKLFETYENHVTVSCIKGMAFDAVILDAFDQLDPFYEDKRQLDKTSSSAITLSNLWATVKLAKSANRSVEFKRSLPPQLTVQNLARLLGGVHGCWVLEDFHKLDQPEKQRLAQAMKMFMDASRFYPDIKVIAVGAVNTAREVVNYDSEMNTRVAEVEVPLMEDNEIRKIVTVGAGKLGITFDALVIDQIVKFANGIPSICHQLCLSSALAAGVQSSADGGKRVESTHLSRAVKGFVESSSDSMRERFDKAVRRKRVRRYDNYSIVLEAICKLELEGGVIGEIMNEVAKVNPGYPRNNVTRYADSMTTELRGTVLRKDATSGRYAFMDPFIRSYCMAHFSERNDGLRKRPGPVSPVQIDQIMKELMRALSDVRSRAKKGAETIKSM